MKLPGAKKIILPITFLLLVTLCITIFTLAATTTTTYSSPQTTMHSLDDIYALIDGTPTSTPTLYPNVGPDSPSMHSISELYIKLANLIHAEDLASSSVTYLGVTGGNPTPEPLATSTKEFDPASTPGTITGFTLDDIYNLVTNTTDGTSRLATTSHESFEPTSSPTIGTMHTLGDIYDELSTLIDPTNIATGTVYLGRVGRYAPILSCDSNCLALLREGLVAYYPLDSDVSDYSGNSLNGENHGAVANSSSVINGAYNFAYNSIGVSDFPSIENNITFSFWVKPSPGFNGEILSKRLGGTSGEYSVQWVSDDSKITFNTQTMDPNTQIEERSWYNMDAKTEMNSVPADVWSHVVIEYNSSNILMYVNGELQYQSPTMSGDIVANSQPFCLGATGCGADYFIGSLDEVAVWNRALSEAEIDEVYNNGNGFSLIIPGNPENVPPMDFCSHSATDPYCWSADDIIPGPTFWGPMGVVTGANSDNDGAANSALLVGSDYSAAYACANLTEGDHHDWYLPAKQQLNDAFLNNITGFQTGPYWSSTENLYDPSVNAWSVIYQNGVQIGNDKDDSRYNLVRCLR